MPAAGLRPTLGCVMLGSALGVASKAGLDLEAWQILAPPVVLGVLAFFVHRTRSRSGAGVVATAVTPT